MLIERDLNIVKYMVVCVNEFADRLNINGQEAFNYLKTVDFADIVTIGIASEDEAQETFSLLESI